MDAPLDDPTSLPENSVAENADDDVAQIRNEREVEQLSSELAERFQVARDVVESRVRAEFRRWSSVPIKDFVPIFVERAIRGRIRSHAI
jgi:hypothetical protein